MNNTALHNTERHGIIIAACNELEVINHIKANSGIKEALQNCLNILNNEYIPTKETRLQSFDIDVCDTCVITAKGLILLCLHGHNCKELVPTVLICLTLALTYLQKQIDAYTINSI